MEEDPAQREVLAAYLLPRGLLGAHGFADHRPAEAAGLAVALAQLLRTQLGGSTELPVGVGVPVRIDKGVTIGLPREVDLHPVLLGQRQVVEETAERERGRRMRLRQLLSVEPVRLGEERLALNIQVLLEQHQLGTIAIRLGWHQRSLWRLRLMHTPTEQRQTVQVAGLIAGDVRVWCGDLIGNRRRVRSRAPAGIISRMSDLVTQAVARLRGAGVTLTRGLSDGELSKLETALGFTFGPEHRRLLAAVLPTGDSWVDWRHASSDDLRSRLDWPIEGVIVDVRGNAFWPVSWGERPDSPAMAEKLARDHVGRVPRLVPIFSHRYLAADPVYAPSPVFSVHQTDVIYYGDNLLDYIAHEFGALPRQRARPTRVPFWSDLAVNLDSEDL